MALIGNFKREEMKRLSLHDRIDADYFVQDIDGRQLLQINTYGRSSRELPGKVSQSIQLDATSGRQLFDILKDHFGFK